MTAFIHSKDGSQGAEKRYEIRHEPNTSTLSQHSLTQVNEPDNSPSPARKEWISGTAAGVAGMVTQHNAYTMPAGVNLHPMPNGTNRLRAETTWTNDGSMSTFPYGKPYISATVTTYDLGQGYAASKRVEQTQDWWGNLTNMKVFNWGASGGTTPRREYTNTYLGTSLYVSAYIRKRLLSSTMKENGGAPTTLVTNEYDNYGAGCSGGASCVITATTNARESDFDFPVWRWKPVVESWELELAVL